MKPTVYNVTASSLLSLNLNPQALPWLLKKWKVLRGFSVLDIHNGIPTLLLSKGAAGVATVNVVNQNPVNFLFTNHAITHVYLIAAELIQKRSNAKCDAQTSSQSLSSLFHTHSQLVAHNSIDVRGDKLPSSILHRHSQPKLKEPGRLAIENHPSATHPLVICHACACHCP